MRQPEKDFDASYGDRDTPIETRALRVIGKRGPISCANLGAALWGWHTAGNCSCPWARPAGVIVKRLREQGLVERCKEESRMLYSLTRAGERKVRELEGRRR